MWPSPLPGGWGVAWKQEVGPGAAWCSFIVSSTNSLKLSILIPLILAVLLLLLVTASLLALRKMKRQKRGDQIQLTLRWGWAGWQRGAGGWLCFHILMVNAPPPQNSLGPKLFWGSLQHPSPAAAWRLL